MNVLIFPTLSSILIVTCLCVFLRITLNSQKTIADFRKLRYLDCLVSKFLFGIKITTSFVANDIEYHVGGCNDKTHMFPKWSLIFR